MVEKPAEIWVYVPFGTRKLTIQHPQFGILRDYQIPCAIDKGRTYILKLNIPSENRIYDSSKKQKMILQVSPATSMVEINNIPLDHNPSGIYEKSYSFGTYDVTISNDNYYTQRRKVEICNPDKPHVLRVDLKPMFGWLTINGEGDETIYIDENPSIYQVNTIFTLNSGTYRLKIEKPFHMPYETTVAMNDSLDVKLDPTFIPIYSAIGLPSANQSPMTLT